MSALKEKLIGTLEEKFPKDQDIPNINKVAIVTDSEVNVKIQCPLCKEMNHIQIGKGIDKKNPERYVRYSAINCRNCRKTIPLDEESIKQGKSNPKVVSALNVLTFDLDDIYITSNGKVVAVAGLGKTLNVEKIDVTDIVFKEDSNNG